MKPTQLTNFLWQAGSRLLGFQLKVGDYRRKFKLCVNLLLYPVNFSSVKDRRNDTAEQGGRSIVFTPGLPVMRRAAA